MQNRTFSFCGDTFRIGVQIGSLAEAGRFQDTEFEHKIGASDLARTVPIGNPSGGRSWPANSGCESGVRATLRREQRRGARSPRCYLRTKRIPRHKVITSLQPSSKAAPALALVPCDIEPIPSRPAATRSICREGQMFSEFPPRPSTVALAVAGAWCGVPGRLSMA